jgi:hypothetical protein
MPVNPVSNVSVSNVTSPLNLPTDSTTNDSSSSNATQPPPTDPGSNNVANASTDNPAAAGWQQLYNDTLQRMQQATSPELKAHFQAELQVIASTLAALGTSTDNGPNTPPNNPPGNPPNSPPNTPPNSPPNSPPGNNTVDTGGFDTSVPSGAYTSQQSADMAKQVATQLMSDFGFSKEQAAGIVGNLMLESAGMNPDVNEMAPGSPGMYGPPASGDNGYGWGQWSSDRKTQFLDFAKQNNLQVGSPAANYAFLVNELKTTQAATVDAMKAAKTVPDAVDAFLKNFEKATTPNEGSRLTDANQVYATLG